MNHWNEFTIGATTKGNYAKRASLTWQGIISLNGRILEQMGKTTHVILYFDKQNSMIGVKAAAGDREHVRPGTAGSRCALAAQRVDAAVGRAGEPLTKSARSHPRQFLGGDVKQRGIGEYSIKIRCREIELQKILLPSSLIAGFIGLALSPQALGVLPPGVIEIWAALPGRLISVVFACMFLGHAIPSLRTVWREAGPQMGPAARCRERLARPHLAAVPDRRERHRQCLRD